MSQNHPPLGSSAVHLPQSKIFHVNESTCLQLSVFKDVIREYRKLDDTITMRLNRANAQFRDLDRTSHSRTNKFAGRDEEVCAHVWKELVRNWKDRTEIIQYCVGVVDAVLDAKSEATQGQEPALDGERKRVMRSSRYADEVKRNQIHNELAIESIVRQRSFDAFKSRCKYFMPPLTDEENRKWWDAAQAGR